MFIRLFGWAGTNHVSVTAIMSILFSFMISANSSFLFNNDRILRRAINSPCFLAHLILFLAQWIKVLGFKSELSIESSGVCMTPGEIKVTVLREVRAEATAR